MTECCICYDECEDPLFNCGTCNAGKVCDGCILDFDRIANNKCPCCRQTNWRYIYSDVIMGLINFEFEECDVNDAMRVIVRNFVYTKIGDEIYRIIR